MRDEIGTREVRGSEKDKIGMRDGEITYNTHFWTDSRHIFNSY